MTRVFKPMPEPRADAEALPCDRDAFRAERERMVTAQIERDGINNPRILQAFRRVPRHAFVPDALRNDAYQDRPLPLGFGQTISQPFIVAAMTAAVAPTAADKCLEVGTGSGYQTAILAELCNVTYSIEYLPAVAEQGRKNIESCGYAADRIRLKVGDGYLGWPELAPFDVVVVTAAPEQVPLPLLEQLAVGGRLVIPVGPRDRSQRLELWIRHQPGAGRDALSHRVLLDVRFVPMLGRAESR